MSNLKTSIYLDPQSGGYTITNGQLTETQSAISKVNLLLLQQTGKWIYGLNYGNSNLSAVRQPTVNQLTTGINNCLSVLIASGSIISFTILNITKTIVGKYIVSISITTPNNQVVTIEWKR